MMGTSLSGSFNLKMYFKLNSYYQRFYCRQLQNNFLFLWCKNCKENLMEKMYTNFEKTYLSKKNIFFSITARCEYFCVTRPWLKPLKLKSIGEDNLLAVQSVNDATKPVQSVHVQPGQYEHTHTHRGDMWSEHVTMLTWPSSSVGSSDPLGECHDWCGCEGATSGRLPDNFTFPWGCALQIGH